MGHPTEGQHAGNSLLIECKSGRLAACHTWIGADSTAFLPPTGGGPPDKTLVDVYACHFLQQVAIWGNHNRIAAAALRRNVTVASVQKYTVQWMVSSSPPVAAAGRPDPVVAKE